MVGIILALAGAAALGSVLLISMKIGGNVNSQMLGISIGFLIVSAGSYLFAVPIMNNVTWVFGFVSGLLLAVGMYHQLLAAKKLGVSKTVPVTSGLQLIGITFFSVLLFKEWSSPFSLALGGMAIILISCGILLISLWIRAVHKKDHSVKFTFTLIYSALGFIGFLALNRFFDLDQWSAMFPQGLGLTAGTALLSLKGKPFTKFAFRNIVTGLALSAGNIFLILSLPLLGTGPSFSFAQLGTALSTAGGLYLLRERSTRKQAAFILISSILIIAGGVALGYTKG
ncbi:GRP family sugar transporter [Metabacillus sp. RGM 3146]|uniref:GRP family sugar transporter n=1 Tax=Metabacillus sp. RGM 3146 TaxID=3401092 RepID=UPI003B9CC13C